MAAIEVARHNARPPHRTAAAPPADYATRRGRHRSPGRTRRSLLPPGSGDRGGWRRRTVPGGRGRPRRVGRECCGCRRTPQQHCALLPRYGVGVCTPTGTPTSRVPRVSAAFRRCTRNTVTCGNRILAETGGPVAYIWGSSGRRFKSCQPDQGSSRSEAVSEKSWDAFFIPPRGVDSNADSNG
jgi:hypothetical protein